MSKNCSLLHILKEIVKKLGIQWDIKSCNKWITSANHHHSIDVEQYNRKREEYIQKYLVVIHYMIKVLKDDLMHSLGIENGDAQVGVPVN